MGYSRENLKKIKEQFKSKRINAEAEAEARIKKLEKEYPDLKALNKVISETSLRIVDAIMGPDRKNARETLAEIEKEYNQNVGFRVKFLETYGYPEDYLDVHYECSDCKDEGFDDRGNMCHCMRRALALATYKSSGIGKLIEKQSFENFDLKYYRGKERDNLSEIVDKIKEFASDFTSKTTENLLLCGTTGLGKTHLSTAVAKVVIDKGYDVVYESAQNIFDAFESAKFSGCSLDEKNELTDKYFDCDLLIIDDLGTEMSTQFTVSCLYNLINTRMNAEKPMIINTNLERDKLRERYADRITSRLYGEFSVLQFKGKDIRAQKLDE